MTRHGWYIFPAPCAEGVLGDVTDGTTRLRDTPTSVCVADTDDASFVNLKLNDFVHPVARDTFGGFATGTARVLPYVTDGSGLGSVSASLM